MAQPTPEPTHYEQTLAALDTARYMSGHIAPDDMPTLIEAAPRMVFAAAGLPDVVGVILHGVPSLEALDRLRTAFSGEVTRTRRASTDTGMAYTEHELVGAVRGVPYLATLATDHERLPLQRRTPPEDPKDDAPDMVLVPLAPQAEAVAE